MEQRPDHEDNGTHRNKRQKKTSLACYSCQKSHYPCDEGRPCQSCLKRGKADSCRDGVKKKAKYLEAVREASTAGPIVPNRGVNPIFVQNRHKGVSNDNLLILAQSANLESVPDGMAPIPSLQLPPASQLERRHHPRSASLSSSQSQHHQNLMQTNRIFPPNHNRYQQSMAGTSFPPPTIPHHDQMIPVRPYDYAKSYHHILDFLQVRLKPENLVKVCKALIRVRTCLIALLKGLQPGDLIFMEHCFQRSLPGVSKVLSMVSLPSCVWRRTGELVYSNKELFMITGWAREILCDGRRMIFELLDEPGIVTYWERYSELGTEPSTSSFCFPCSLKRPDGQWILGALWVSIRRDIFNLPIVLVGNFLPNLWRNDLANGHSLSSVPISPGLK